MSDPVTVTVEGKQANVALEGEFDMPATFTVEPALERVVERAGARRDHARPLAACSFIDSTGVGVLLRLEEESRARGVALTIVPGPREVQRVFELAGLDDALPFARPRPGAG